MADKSQNKKQNQKEKRKGSTKQLKINKSENNKKRRQADEKSARTKKTISFRKVLTWTILLGIVIGISVFLCRSELFGITNIETSGNTQVVREALVKLSEINLKENIFLTNTSKAEKRIKQNAYIQEVKIKRILPDKIKIEIVEKQKLYMIQLDEKIAYIDKKGEVLELTNIKPDNLIELQGYSTPKEKIQVGKILEEEDLKRLEDIQEILKSSEKIEIRNKIKSINIQNRYDYILSIPEYKKIIYIGDTSNLANKMLYAKAILEQSAEQEGKVFLNGKFNEGFDPYFREESNKF